MIRNQLNLYQIIFPKGKITFMNSTIEPFPFYGDRSFWTVTVPFGRSFWTVTVPFGRSFWTVPRLKLKLFFDISETGKSVSATVSRNRSIKLASVVCLARSITFFRKNVDFFSQC